ncbi:MAG: carbamate kinase [Actinomycetota bacterium]|nr:carbamate kinase [Actinomycetota bacterium]
MEPSAAQSRKPILVIALGGNAITRADDDRSVEAQFGRTRATVELLLPVIASRRWRVVITHGNGPQVGSVLLRSDLAAEVGALPRLPIDVAVSDTQGGMGYMIQQVLGNAVWEAGLHQPVVTVITQVIVDEHDPDFRDPSKPIGRFYPEASLGSLEAHGWAMKPDGQERGWRRVVASPEPKEIVELPVVAELLAAGVIVIACGGGGIPVVAGTAGSLEGVEAVIDKDLASALLATQLKADTLAILTAVERVYTGFGTEDQGALDELNVDALRALAAAGHFAPGSMGPKVEAVARFVEAGGARSIITDPEHLEAALEGSAGTRVVAPPTAGPTPR